jgi:mono/diheme cytochrome c family protein
MPVFFLKSMLSLGIVLLTLVAMFTMFELFGRAETRFSAGRLRNIHRVNGIIYILLFIATAYLCLDYLMRTKAEPSPRAVFHSAFAMSVIILLTVKIIFMRFYGKYYDQVKVIGLLIALITFGMAGFSGGYYLLVTKFGTEKRIRTEESGIPKTKTRKDLADPEKVAAGRKLFMEKCSFCHDPESRQAEIGPGLKGILDHQFLPVSNRPATPGNIARQLRRPYRDMPSFAYLTDDQIGDIIAYLSTL